MNIDKKALSEEDIKRLYITPAIERKWDKWLVTMEHKITDGKVNIKGNRVVREKPKSADYVLSISPNNPIAVVEAKDNNHTASHGMQQAIAYAQMLDVPFAYASNGDFFVEHDFITGTEREISMDDFPTLEELQARFREGKHLTPEQEKVIQQPYYGGLNVYPPRYYQRIAINRTLDAIARSQDRILLVMATGTGKTYTAFQIVYRLLQSGMKRKILYLADRNFLVDQSIQQDFQPLEKVTHKIDMAKDSPATLTSYQVYFSLYQQLVGENGDEKNYEAFDKDFFDLVIVDECHRGSAKADSLWRCILEYFSGATQIGMTATPKETSYQSNINYFGKPLYVYSLNSGIEDGFLAPFRVMEVKLNVGDGWRPLKGQVDKFGNPIPDRVYGNSDFDYTIVLEDRIREVAERITAYLKRTDRFAKTIVFCADEAAAERMRVALVNANSDMVRENPDYVVRITGSDVYGKSKLKYFISTSEKYPVIATTSQMLSTGLDCKMVKLIVLDKCISSLTEFKQIVGRGTRLRWDVGKTHFCIMDLRNVTRLFADQEWDGPIEPAPGFPPSEQPPQITGGVIPPPMPPEPQPPVEPLPPRPPKPIVSKDGCVVEVWKEIVSIYDCDGKLLRRESVIDYTKETMLGKYASLDDFIQGWTSEEKKKVIKDVFLEDHGIDLDELKAKRDMSDVDDFDFLCHVAFDQKPLTRRERANNVKKRDFFGKYSGAAREVLEALLERYADSGIYDLEDTKTLNLSPFLQMGKLAKIMSFFGGKDSYRQAVRELEAAIYERVAI